MFFLSLINLFVFFFFFQAEDGIRDDLVTGVQTCALPILPRTGELNPDFVKKALGLSNNENYAPCEDVTSRPPALCQGCGHRDVYSALNEVLRDYENARVFGDIGCYTLGFQI